MGNAIAKTVRRIRTICFYSNNRLQCGEKDARRISLESGKPSLKFIAAVTAISRDRWFLDRIATHILAFEGNSQVTFFDGNYQEYEADKNKRPGEEGAKPKRIRHKPLRE